MPAASYPDDENDRLAALLALRILDTDRSVEFDIFPDLASKLFDAPISAISLIDHDRQWFKSSIGLDVSQTPRQSSFCAHAILNPDETLYVADATKDARFADNPLVTGTFGLRFYAGAPIIGPSGHAMGALCVIDRKPREVSEETLGQLRKLAVAVGSALKLHGSVQDMQALALTDPLTGLHNRASLEQRLETALRQRKGAGQVGLIFVDLDGFRSINDLFGHAGGDAALQEVARRLRAVTRSRDSLGRFGGDEFCVLVDDLDDVRLERIGARIHAALSRPFALDGQTIPLRTSIGVAVSHDDSDVRALLREADTALFEAKRAGRGVTRFAAHGAGGGPVAIGRNGLQEMLRDALFPPGREPFSVAMQPIFDLRHDRLAGFEALVRWPCARGRVMQPDEFIPTAEATGLVVHLDRWVLNQACALAASWPEHLRISANLSAANFFAGDLVADVRAILKRHGLEPGRLKLEVTETVLLRDPTRVKSIISKLRQLGAHVVLDDFGAGHASLAYLRDYPFDGLKIDRMFVADLETSAQSRAFTNAILGMARALDIETTVEGVETEGQLALLKLSSVTLAQGYLLGRPLTPAAAHELILAERKAGGAEPSGLEVEALDR